MHNKKGMERKRFYFNKEYLKDNIVCLKDDEYHHMINVMRLRVGDSVVLFCGDGLDYTAQIENISKKEATLRVKEIKQNNSEIGFGLTVYQALAKGEKLSLIAQKLTEIGATGLKVFSSEFCDVKPNTARLDKLDKVVISASKQCGRSALLNAPESALKFSDLIKEIKKYDVCYLAYENETGLTLHEDLIKHKALKNVAVIIGPEGGFSNAEAKTLTDSGAVSVSLGGRILRTETAAIFAASVIVGVLEKLQK